MAAGPAQVWRVHGALVVDGPVDGAEAPALGEAMLREAASISGPLQLDLRELEPLDGVAVAELVTALRALLARHGRLELIAAPQMLAHTLYRVGLLEDGRLVVREVVSEEPTTAN